MTIRTASDAKENREDTRASELQMLLGALDNVARAAKLGGRLRKLLLDVVSQSNVRLSPAIDPRSTWAVVVSPSGSAFRPNVADTEIGNSPDVGKRAATEDMIQGAFPSRLMESGLRIGTFVLSPGTLS
jgi:hypothetical protein